MGGVLMSGLWMAGSTASAQWDPESGDTGEWQPPPEEQPPAQQPPAQQPNQWQQPQQQPPAQQPPAQQQQSGWYNNSGQSERPPGMAASATVSAEAPPVNVDDDRNEGDTDHSKVSFGVGFFGVEDTVLEAGGLLDPEREFPALSLRVTTIGVRLWVADAIGLDIGLGLGFRTSEDSSDVVGCPGGPDCGFSSRIGGVSSAYAVKIHLGLPIALKTYSHFNVLLSPELGFTYGGFTVFAPEDSRLDASFSAVHLDLGIRVGGELQFGFWGVPNLSLQATVGLGFRYSSHSVSNEVPFSEPGAVGGSTSGIALTTVADHLGSIVRLFYYF